MKLLSPISRPLCRAFIAVATLTLFACGADDHGGTGAGKGGGGGTGGSATGGGGDTGGGGSGAVGGKGGSGGTGGSAGQGGGGGTGGTGGAAGTGGTGGAAGSGGKGGAAGTGGTGGVAGSGGKSGAAGAGGAGPGGSSGSGGSAGTGGAAGTAGQGGAGGGSVDAGGSVDGGGSNGCGNTNLPAACNTKATGPCTINVAGTDRTYFIVLPPNYNANTPYPLMFAWHGATDVAENLLDTGPSLGAGFYKIKATFPNAIYVTAQGLVGAPGNVTGWPNTNGQDVALAKAMIAQFESTYCVDTSRIFSTGMSFGGMMSNLLACQMPDVFRAIGVMAGSLNGGNCGTHPIASWAEHGDADTTVNISGGIKARDLFIQHNGCDTTNTQTAAMPDGKTTCTIYNTCTSGKYPVVWCPIPGQGHQIATWAGAEMSKFFQQF